MSDVTLNFEHKFPLCSCPHCNHRYVVLAIWGYNEGDDSLDYMPQVNTNAGGMYCPYCGVNSKQKPLPRHLTREGGLLGATEEYLENKENADKWLNGGLPCAVCGNYKEPHEDTCILK